MYSISTRSHGSCHQKAGIEQKEQYHHKMTQRKHTRNVFLDRLHGGATTSSGGIAVVYIRVLGCPACRDRWVSLDEANQIDLQHSTPQEEIIGDLQGQATA